MAPVEAILTELLATRSRVLQFLEQLEPRHLDLEFDRDGLPVRFGDLLATFSSHDQERAAQ